MPEARYVCSLSEAERKALRELYRSTENANMRTRCQMVLHMLWVGVCLRQTIRQVKFHFDIIGRGESLQRLANRFGDGNRRAVY